MNWNLFTKLTKTFHKCGHNANEYDHVELFLFWSALCVTVAITKLTPRC